LTTFCEVITFITKKTDARCEEPRAGARGFFYGKSHLHLGANRPQNYMAIHPRSGERGILAFSRNRLTLPMVPEKREGRNPAWQLRQ
jgi:hypothetical protein